jgi:serine/threonine-protein kinase
VEVEAGGTGSSKVKAQRVAGTPFGSYTLLCKLATGGMGELFVARKSAAGGFEKLVVIKRLLPHLAEDSHFVAMLLDEARIAARLSHSNVCQVYDLGEVGGHYYIAMEHLEGVPASLVLRRASRAGQRLELGLAAAILHQAAAGLDHAHDLCDNEGRSVGLVHRDVSPSNLFVTTAGVVKVLDFGVAKSQDALARTHTGALKGKYAYMSPEQVLGNPVDRRSDVWSLGIVLYELLTAQRLFWRDSEYKMFQAIVSDSIPSLLERRPGLPVRVAKVAERALSREPGQRFAGAREMGEALEEAMANAGGIWKPSDISAYLTEHFAGLIQERRDDVQAGLARAARSTLPPATILEEADGPAEESTGDADPGGVEVEMTPPQPTRQHPASSRAWLRGLALAAALGGGGVFAYRQWEPPAASPPPIVLIDGEVEASDGTVTRARRPQPSPPRPAAPRTPSPDPTGEPVEPDPTEPAGAGLDPAAADPEAGPASSSPDPYGARIGRHQAEFRRCFNQTDTAIEGAPSVAVKLAIDRRGAVIDAHLVPQELEGTQVGGCVLAVVRRIGFGRRSSRVDVEIPLVIRRRR